MCRKLMLVMMVMCLAITLSFAASKGTSGAAFLKVITAPRAAALGGTYAAFSGDVNSIAFNPAGLAFLKKKEVVFVQNSWIQDIINQYIAFGMPLNNFGALGLGINMLSVKDMTRVASNGVADGTTFNSSDMAVTLTCAKTMGEKLNMGLNIKMISCSIEDESASAYAVDLGGLYAASEKLDLGLAIQNLGTQLKFIDEGDPLPMTIKLGCAYKPSDKLLAGIDINSPNDSDLSVSIGGEYCLSGGEKLMLPIRVGYKTGLADAGSMAGLGAGLGILYNDMLGIDFTWTPMGDLGDSMKFGLRLKF